MCVCIYIYIYYPQIPLLGPSSGDGEDQSNMCASRSWHMCVYICVYMCIYIYIYTYNVYIYIYIHILCVYIYIYIHARMYGMSYLRRCFRDSLLLVALTSIVIVVDLTIIRFIPISPHNKQANRQAHARRTTTTLRSCKASLCPAVTQQKLLSTPWHRCSERLPFQCANLLRRSN